MFKKMSIALLFLLTGCLQQPKDEAFERALTLYESHYFSILDNDRFLNESNHFSFNVEKYELSSGYRYDFIIDQPLIAMYDIVVVMVENNQDFESLTTLSPSLGVFDTSINLVPNQVNSDKGFPKGILLSGVSSSPQLQLKVMVAWKDYYKLKQMREYYLIEIDFLAENVLEELPENETEDGLNGNE